MRHEEELVRETDEYLFYRDWVSDNIEDALHSPDRDGITLRDLRAMKAVNRETGEKEYFVYDGDGHVHAIISDLYDMDLKVALLKMNLKADCDLRTIVETGKVPKVV